MWIDCSADAVPQAQAQSVLLTVEGVKRKSCQTVVGP